MKIFFSFLAFLTFCELSSGSQVVPYILEGSDWKNYGLMVLMSACGAIASIIWEEVDEETKTPGKNWSWKSRVGDALCVTTLSIAWLWIGQWRDWDWRLTYATGTVLSQYGTRTIRLWLYQHADRVNKAISILFSRDK